MVLTIKQASEDIRKRPPAGRLPLGAFHLAQPSHYLKELPKQQLFPPQHFGAWLSTLQLD